VDEIGTCPRNCVGVKKVKALNEKKAGMRERDLGVLTLKFT